MEYYIDISYPSLLPLSEKPIQKLTIQAVLSGTHTPENWVRLVRQNDPNQDYIVTSLSQFKERSVFPDFQHEYIVLYVRAREPTTNPPIVTAIRVSRTIVNHSLPARLGLWGPLDDTVTVLGDAEHVQIRDERVSHLTWAPNEAPDLERVSTFVVWVRRLLPQYCLLKTSCYSFARAISDSVLTCLNGIENIQRPPFLMRRSHFLHVIPVGITRARGATRAMVAFTGHIWYAPFSTLIDLLFTLIPEADGCAWMPPTQTQTRTQTQARTGLGLGLDL